MVLKCRILKIVLEVMYKDLRDWMIYGNLTDKYEEFYICYDINKTIASNTTKTNTDLEEDAGIVTNELDDLFIGTRFSSNYSQFVMMSSRLPSFINLKIANHILFTGELLQLFQAKFLNEIYSSGGIDSLNFQLAQNLSLNKVQYVSEFDKSLFIFLILFSCKFHSNIEKKLKLLRLNRI
jgi:hypothetical protein